MFGGVARVLNAHLPNLEGYVTDLTGRALEWHSRGQRFEPAYLHQTPRTQWFSVFSFIFRTFGHDFMIGTPWLERLNFSEF